MRLEKIEAKLFFKERKTNLIVKGTQALNLEIVISKIVYYYIHNLHLIQ